MAPSSRALKPVRACGLEFFNLLSERVQLGLELVQVSPRRVALGLERRKLGSQAAVIALQFVGTLHAGAEGLEFGSHPVALLLNLAEAGLEVCTPRLL